MARALSVDPRRAGATPLFLPPCAPEFAPIEHAFAALKVLLRRATARTRDGANDVAAAGHEPE
jgi:transposase